MASPHVAVRYSFCDGFYIFAAIKTDFTIFFNCIKQGVVTQILSQQKVSPPTLQKYLYNVATQNAIANTKGGPSRLVFLNPVRITNRDMQ
jgi:hypothetical protein